MNVLVAHVVEKTIAVWMKNVTTVEYVLEASLDPTVIQVSYFYTTYTLSLCG